jgi:hypothetical protein
MPREGGASSNRRRQCLLDYPLSRVMTALRGARLYPNRYFISENAVGVLPVTCRKAWENAGTLA